MATSRNVDPDVFYKKQFNIFKYFGLWEPPKYLSRSWQLAYHAYFLHILIFWLAVFDLCCLIQFISNISSLNEIIKVFFIFATAIGVMAKFLSIKFSNHIFMDIFRKMHSEDFLPVNPHEDKIYLSAMSISCSNRNIYAGLSLTALTLVMGTQYIIDNTELPMSVYNPINIDSTWRYIIMYLYQCIAVSMCCLTNIGFDSIASSFFIYLKLQLTILANRLKYIGQNAGDSQEVVNKQLIDCIRFYNKILQLTQTIENVVAIPMSMQVVSSILVLIANSYAMAFLTEPADYANLAKWVTYQLCMLTQIFILCYFANEVSLQSVELSNALYSSQWFSWNKVNRKLVLLMMLRFDTPIRIHTVNRCYSFNLAAFTSIVNSSYSYFALLKKMNA